jgi:hypothetical protein
MLRIIKSHRGAKTKEFIGVVGTYFIEILDDDPFITNFLTSVKGDYLHAPSESSRFLTPDERMVLKCHDKNSLAIFKSERHHESYACSLKLFIYRHTSHAPKELLTDALRLAASRWSKIIVKESLYPLHESIRQPVAEILAALSSQKN